MIESSIRRARRYLQIHVFAAAGATEHQVRFVRGDYRAAVGPVYGDAQAATECANRFAEQLAGVIDGALADERAARATLETIPEQEGA